MQNVLLLTLLHNVLIQTENVLSSGFLNITDVASPPTISKHLVLPFVPSSEKDQESPDVVDLEGWPAI